MNVMMMGCCKYFYGMLAVGSGIIGYAIYRLVMELRNKWKLQRWDNTPKDVVILHSYPRGRTIPCFSPGFFKLETYLRLAKINYERDDSDIFGQNMESPWISINGRHIGDTESIIEYLNRKFDKNLNSRVAEDVLAAVRMTRVVLEELLFRGIILERLKYAKTENVRKVIGDYVNIRKLSLQFYKRKLMNREYEHGIAHHSREEIVSLISKYLKDASVILGNKMYFGGNEMCQEDCGIFGVLGQFVWGTEDSPYNDLLNGECVNLKAYCLRIKDVLWSDWESQLAL